MKHFLATLAVAAAAIIVLAGCSQAAPPAPTAAPKAAEPTKAAAPAAQPSQPTKAPEAAKPTSGTSTEVQKPADWPKKSVSVVVPADAGGATDVGARLLTALMEKQLGTTMEVINKPGGGTQIGTTEIATAKPDGYTIGYTLLPATITTYLDPERKAVFTMDTFAPVGLHVFDPGTISVAAESK